MQRRKRESVYFIDPELTNGTTIHGKDLWDWAVNTVVRLFENTSHAELFLWPYHEW